ncbi:MAG: hypothetical protein EAZ99_19450 [Alphaproteobacteria bacterium]|nr:hypothetical protein [Alphaproteobacteria bacterium]TAD86793.1 MAG: hypothetical protein EAZ99_19450 [Alphaproteobacteria bacterium]
MLLDTWPNHAQMPERTWAAHYFGYLESRLLDLGITRLERVTSCQRIKDWRLSDPQCRHFSPLLDPARRDEREIDRRLISIAAMAGNRMVAVYSALSYPMIEGLREAVRLKRFPYDRPDQWHPEETITCPPEMPNISGLVIGWFLGFWVDPDWRSGRDGGGIGPLMNELIRIGALMAEPRMAHQVGVIPHAPKTPWLFWQDGQDVAVVGRGCHTAYHGWHHYHPNEPLLGTAQLLMHTPSTVIWQRARDYALATHPVEMAA